MSREDSLIEEISEAQRRGDWHRLEPLLAELTPRMRPELVNALLSTLVDDREHETLLFGILHLAERIDTELYVQGVIEALPTMSQKAPRWARTVLARVFNANEAYGSLLKLLPKALPIQREALREIGTALGNWKPDRFFDKTSQLAEQLNVRDP